jgi:Tol biopolymer transport system component
MDADGDDQRRLTETESLDEAAPSWSPDGSRIAYAREGPARFTQQLMIVNADGSQPTRLIGDASVAKIDVPWFTAPAWRPD